MSDYRKISGFHLNVYQSEFVQRFLSPDSPPNHLLAAPTGSGKTLTTSAIVYEMVKMGARRILILVPALILADQYKRSLSEIEMDIKVISLDRKIIREIDFLNQKDTFLSKSIAIATLRQAADYEIRDSILSTHWDLIVVDESEHFLANVKDTLFMKTMAEKQIAQRLLLLTDRVPNTMLRENIDEMQLGKFLDRFVITKWTRKDIFPSNRARKIRFDTISYKRTEEEIEFIKKYTDLSKWLSNRTAQNKIRTRLVSSSIYAAEESLRNLRNQLVHGELNNLFAVNEYEKDLIHNEELLGDINSAQIDKKFSSKDFPKLMNDLSVTLEVLDNIQIDSKFNVLSQIVKEMQRKEQRTWIYASYQSTISFLHSSLVEATQNVYQIHGQMPSYHVSDSIRRFREDGGFLISSTSRLMGINFSLDNLILYDTPENENLIYTIFTRIFGPYTGEVREPVNITVFDDISNAIKSERNRLKKAQRLVQELMQEDI